jgi:hypothetical protein
MARDLLESLYSLNQENSPEVGFIPSIELFSKLFQTSSLNLLIKYKNKIAGFVICFRENSVYKYIDEVAAKESLPICCEVNSIPLNQISLNFHAKNGFIKVGERDFKDHSVRYLQK